jgi:hypothetical protein
MGVNEIFDELCKNDDFLSSIDNKINEKYNIDINEIIFIITFAYNKYSYTKIYYMDFPLLLKTLFLFVIKKYNLIKPEELPFIENKVNSAIKLVMIHPIITKYKFN